jgi:hypothetical protein
MHRRQLLRGVGTAISGAGLTAAVGPIDARGQQQTGQDEAGAFEPLGSVAVPGAREAAVHHDGEIAYVAASDGFAVVDISDPRDPTVRAKRREIDTDGQGEFRGVWDVWPWQDRLVVAGPALPPGGAQGFALFDISDPSNPVQVAWYGTEFYIHNAFLDDGTVYLTGSGVPTAPLVMVDIADDDPTEVARWSPLDHDPGWGEILLPSRVLHDAFVQDGIAYLPYWDAGTWIVDVSEPQSPEMLARVGDYTLEELQDIEGRDATYESTIPPGNAHNTVVNEDATLLFVGTESWAVGDPSGDSETIGGPGGIDIWDITDKTSPTHRAEIAPPESADATTSGPFTTAHNCDVVGDRLYSSWYFGGVKIHDISDPANPVEIAWWQDADEACFWTAQSAVPDEVFVGSSVSLENDFRGQRATAEQLYTFPDRPGTQPNSQEDTGDSGSNQSTKTPEPTPTQTPEPTKTADPTASNESTSEADDSGPGFGVFGALGAVGSLAYALRRRSDRTDTEE